MTASLFVAAFFALVVGQFITFVYVPSAVKSTLQLRYGQIATLGDPTFDRLRRENLKRVSHYFGIIVWGMVYTSLIFAALLGGTVFLYLWQVSRETQAASRR